MRVTDTRLLFCFFLFSIATGLAQSVTAPRNGGTGQDTSSSTGYPSILSGIWSVSPSINLTTGNCVTWNSDTYIGRDASTAGQVDIGNSGCGQIDGSLGVSSINNAGGLAINTPEVDVFGGLGVIGSPPYMYFVNTANSGNMELTMPGYPLTGDVPLCVPDNESGLNPACWMGAQTMMGSDGILVWLNQTSATNYTAIYNATTLGTQQTGISSPSAGVIDFDTTTAGNKAATGNIATMNVGTALNPSYLTTSTNPLCYNGTSEITCANTFAVGTLNTAAQYDVPYYSAAGTAGTLSGAAISGFQYDSTSGAPAAATAAQLGTLANIAHYEIILSAGTSSALTGLAPSSTSGLPLLSQGSSANPAYGALALSGLATQSANTVDGNGTGSTAAPAALSMPSCSAAADALQWTSGTGFACNTSITAAAVPASGITGTTLATNVVTASLTTLTSQLTSYDGVSCYGLCFPLEENGLDQTGVSTANSGSAQNLIASPGAGRYVIHYYIDQSAGCTTVGSGKATVVFNWTDATAARNSSTLTLTPGTADTGATSYLSGNIDLWSAASDAITMTVTYTACTSGTWKYDNHTFVYQAK